MRAFTPKNRQNLPLPAKRGKTGKCFDSNLYGNTHIFCRQDAAVSADKYAGCPLCRREGKNRPIPRSGILYNFLFPEEDFFATIRKYILSAVIRTVLRERCPAPVQDSPSSRDPHNADPRQLSADCSVSAESRYGMGEEICCRS